MPPNSEELAEGRHTCCDMHKGPWEVEAGGEWGLGHTLMLAASSSWEGLLHSPTCTSLFAKGIPLPRAQVSPMTLATKVLRGEVFLQHHSSQDGLPSQDARPWSRG